MKKLVCMLAVGSAVSMLGVRAADDVDGLLDDLSDAKETQSTETASDEGSDESSDESSESADESETASGEEGEEGGADQAAPKANGPQDKHFHILPFCRRLELSSADNGTSCGVEVKTPKADWAPIKEGKFYPLGTIYRSRGAQTRLSIQFGPDIEVVVKGEATFGTRAQPLNEKSRSISLIDGTITVKLPRNLPEGLFVVSAPGFKSINPTGESRYTYIQNRNGDGDQAVVRCVTGTLTIEGRHFKVPLMKAANEIKIRTSQDLLFTGLYGLSGDCIVRLDQGLVQVKDFETGENKIEEKILEWKLSPKTAVRIHRAVPAIGERMSVTVMTFDAAGELKNRCAFAEKRFEVNSGELGPTSKKDREEIAKKAAEATETVSAEEGNESADAESASEEASEEDSSSGDDEM